MLVFGRISMLLVCFSLADGHWAVLHSIAWSQMIHDYEAEGSLVEAVVKIATSQEACHACEEAAEAESDAPSAAGGRTEMKTELFGIAQDTESLALIARPYQYMLGATASGTARSDEPAYPVPKLI